jgi:EmrB/QacA subfamily drug resistance transporter
MTTTNGPALAYASAPGRWVLAITVLGSGIAALDATVVNIALPTIGRDFHTGIAALQWVMTSYILTLAAFLLIGGSLGDRFGRRRVYLIGIVWFALASAACGFAPNADFLIITRVLQGIGGALLTPGSLAILEASFTPADRGRAIGAWSGLGGVAIAAGPLIGGYLIAAASWRWIFFINLPIAAVVVVLGARHIPESRDPAATGRLDFAGALAAVVFLAGITFAFIEAPTLGWSSPTVLTMSFLGLAGLVAFGIREQRAAAPMLPLSIFADRQFAAASAVTFIVYGALTGATFLLPVVLQVVEGYSPLASGLAMLPLTIIMLALSARSGELAARIGPRLQLTVGPIIAGVGLAMLTLSTSGSSYVVNVLPPVVVFGVGIAVVVAPLTSTAMSSAPAHLAGVASAVNNDLSRFGGLLAVAILPALAGITGQAYLHPAALAAGFRTAAFISGGLCAAGGLLAAVTITNPRRGPEPAATPANCLHCALDAAPLAVAPAGYAEASSTVRSA